MAKQHIYARTGSGLYTGLAGLDTIGVSAGLSEEYVKRNLHRFCFYLDAPGMPPVYFLAHIEKDTIYGRNIYIKDIRASFLSHMLIASAAELSLLHGGINCLLDYDLFAARAPEATGDLPDIKLSDDVFSHYIYQDLLFSCLKMTKGMFTAITHYAALAVLNSKTLIVKLGCDRRYASQYAGMLMKFICDCLPDDILKRLSFVTYSPTTALPCFFHVVFLDAECQEADASKDYYLDFTKPFEPDCDEPYMDYVWSNVAYANQEMIKTGSIFKNSPVTDIACLNAGAQKQLDFFYRIWNSLELMNFDVKTNIDKYIQYVKIALEGGTNIGGGVFSKLVLLAQSTEWQAVRLLDIKHIEYLFIKPFPEGFSDEKRESLASLFFIPNFAERYYIEMLRQLSTQKKSVRALLLLRLYRRGIARYFPAGERAEYEKRLTQKIGGSISETALEALDNMGDIMKYGEDEME